MTACRSMARAAATISWRRRVSARRSALPRSSGRWAAPRWRSARRARRAAAARTSVQPRRLLRGHRRDDAGLSRHGQHRPLAPWVPRACRSPISARPRTRAARPELGDQRARRAAAGLQRHRLRCASRLPSDVRVHWIITKGGTLAQVIPDHVTAVLTVRANNAATLQKVLPRIDACLHRRRRDDRRAAGTHVARQAAAASFCEQRALARRFNRNMQRARAADAAARRDVGAWSRRHRQRELVRADDPAADGDDGA